MSKGMPHFVHRKFLKGRTPYWELISGQTAQFASKVSLKNLKLFPRRSLQRIVHFYSFLKCRNAMGLCLNARNQPFRFKKGRVASCKTMRITGTVDRVVPGSY